MSCSRTTRRGFLQGVAGVGAASALGPGCAVNVDPAPLLTLEATALQAGRLSLQVARYPDLSKDGGALTVRVPGQPDLLVAHPGGSIFFVLDATCTHAGCPMGVQGAEAVCPCHGSRFGADGLPRNPPATVPVATYRSSYDALTGTLTIDLLAGDPNFPAVQDGRVLFPFSQFPELQQPGGFVAGKPAGLGRPLLLLAQTATQHTALDATCTHAGCTVLRDEAAGDLVCPCHDSHFSLDGRVSSVSQAAKRDLARYAAVTDGNGVTVTVA